MSISDIKGALFMLPIENSFLTIDFIELILINSLVSLDLQMYQQNCHVIFFGRSLIRQLKFVFTL